MHSFKTDPNHIQIIIFVYILGLSLSQFFYGPLSDRYGRRIVVILGASTCFAGNLFAIFAHSLVQLIIARFICAFGAGAGMILARVVFRDCFSGTTLLRANSYFSMSVNISPAIAPFIGGLIQEDLGWRWTFLLLAVWAFIVFITSKRNLPETLATEKQIPLHLRSLFHTYYRILKDKPFIYSALLSGTTLGASLTYLFMSPFLYQLTLHLSPSQNGLVYLANAGGFLLGATCVNRLSERYTPYQFIRSGLAICLLAALVLLTLGLWGIINIWVLLIPAGMNSIGSGFVMPATGVIALENMEMGAGRAASLLGGIRLLIVAFCSLLVILVHEFNQTPMASLMLGFSVAGVFFYRELTARSDSGKRHIWRIWRRKT
jgi:DHA1 family 2-module integral membrane pump EmrD-like MFS transporter